MPFVLWVLLFANIASPALSPQIAEAATLSPTLEVSDLQNIALHDAQEYDLTPAQTDRMMKVIQCESGWDVTATGRLGERGLAQIYPAKHPDISEAQMLDPYFSLDYIAKNLYQHPSWWSCFGLVRN